MPNEELKKRATVISVPVQTLDSFALENVLFIKLDVEGYESTIVAGALKTIKRCRPVLQVEIKTELQEDVFNLFHKHLKDYMITTSKGVDLNFDFRYALKTKPQDKFFIPVELWEQFEGTRWLF